MGYLLTAVLIFGLVFGLRALRARERKAFRDTDANLLEEFRNELGQQQPQAPVVSSQTGTVVALPSVANPPDARYERKIVVFDDIRREALLALEAAVGPDYRVLTNVALSDIAKAADPGDAFRLNARRLHFVVTRRSDMVMRCGVYLKGAGREFLEEADFLDALFAQLERPLIVLPLVAGLSVAEMRDALGDSLSLAPSCSRCGGQMQMRKSSRGRAAGRRFWVCRDYPACNTINAIED